jgi:hypothetical protein
VSLKITKHFSHVKNLVMFLLWKFFFLISQGENIVPHGVLVFRSVLIDFTECLSIAHILSMAVDIPALLKF